MISMNIFNIIKENIVCLNISTFIFSLFLKITPATTLLKSIEVIGNVLSALFVLTLKVLNSVFKANSLTKSQISSCATTQINYLLSYHF